jgi:hypothetical protein
LKPNVNSLLIPKEENHKEPSADVNENKTNSNMSSELLKDDAKEAKDNDSIIEEKYEAMPIVDGSKNHENLVDSTSKNESGDSIYIIYHMIYSKLPALDDVLNQHSSNKGNDNEEEYDCHSHNQWTLKSLDYIICAIHAVFMKSMETLLKLVISLGWS